MFKLLDFSEILQDSNGYLLIILSLLMLGDTVGGTVKALEAHSIKSSISKKGLLDKIKIFICLVTLWLAIELLAVVTSQPLLTGTFTIFVIVAIVNEINSLLELLGSDYSQIGQELTNELKERKK